MDYDVIIVGARVASSVLASLSGEHGHRVLLLEKAHFVHTFLPRAGPERL